MRTDDDMKTILGNAGARSWLSMQVWERGADVATFFGSRGMPQTEQCINRLAGRLLAISIRRDRAK